jgi:transketolase
VSTAVAPTPVQQAENQRERFYRLAPELLQADRRLALVLADIGTDYLDQTAIAGVADRVINVGIREQLLIGVAGGLALTGMRPIVHTFAPFLIERPFEQVKLDLDHQDVGAVLVSAGASYTWPVGGTTHFGHRDIALLDTLDGWTVRVPGHPDEVEAMLRAAVKATGRVYIRLDTAANSRARETAGGRLDVVRRGSRGTVIAVGPMLDRVLAATEGRDVTVAYAATVRPFDGAGLRAVLGEPDVAVVEPYLAGTSIGVVNDALHDTRHRVLGLGVGRHELRRYGTVADHDTAHGLDIAGLRFSLDGFFTG